MPQSCTSIDHTFKQDSVGSKRVLMTGEEGMPKAKKEKLATEGPYLLREKKLYIFNPKNLFLGTIKKPRNKMPFKEICYNLTLPDGKKVVVHPVVIQSPEIKTPYGHSDKYFRPESPFSEITLNLEDNLLFTQVMKATQDRIVELLYEDRVSSFKNGSTLSREVVKALWQGKLYVPSQSFVDKYGQEKQYPAKMKLKVYWTRSRTKSLDSGANDDNFVPEANAFGPGSKETKYDKIPLNKIDAGTTGRYIFNLMTVKFKNSVFCPLRLLAVRVSDYGYAKDSSVGIGYDSFQTELAL